MKVVLMGVEVELKKGALWKVPLVLVMMVVNGKDEEGGVEEGEGKGDDGVREEEV